MSGQYPYYVSAPYMVLNRELAQEYELDLVFPGNSAKRKNALYTKLSCKRINHDTKRIRENPIFDKAFIYLPVYFVISMAASTYAEFKHKLKNNRYKLSSDIEMVKNLMNNYTIMEYECKQSWNTNQLPINIVKYLITTYSDYRFFRDLNKRFHFIADCFLNSNIVSDMCMTEDINLGKPINISKINEEYFNIVENTEILFESAKDFTQKSLMILNSPKCTSLSQPEYRKCIRNMYHVICVEETYKIELNTCTFDIEVGVSDSVNVLQMKEVPNALCGYVQCIAMIIEPFSGVYSAVEKKCVIHAYKSKFKTEKITKLLDDLPYVIKCVIFDDEAEMIISTLKIFYAMDVLYSYNGKMFDFSFLVHRYNYLKNTMFTNGYFNSILIYDKKFNNRQKFQCANNYTLYVECKKCSIDLEYSHKSAVYCTKCASECKPVVENMKLKKSAQYSYVIRELPFTYHKDLYTVKIMREKCENFKLETLVNFNLKMNISEMKCVDNGESRTYEITLANKIQDINVMQKILETFSYHIKVVVFGYEPSSGQLTKKHEAILRKIFFSVENSDSASDILLDRTQFFAKNMWILSKAEYIYTNDNSGEIFNFGSGNTVCKFVIEFVEKISPETLIGSNFISVGKTSSQTLVEQMQWKSEQDAVNTIVYCMFDTIVTLQLEKNFYTIINYNSMSTDQMTFFETFDYDPPKQASLVLQKKIWDIGKQLMYCSKSFNHYKNLSLAMKVEWPRIGESEADFYDMNSKLKTLLDIFKFEDNVIKTQCNNTIGQIFDPDRDNIMNEFRNGIEGEIAPDDIGELRRSLEKLGMGVVGNAIADRESEYSNSNSLSMFDIMKIKDG